jgi:hypothetical protein
MTSRLRCAAGGRLRTGLAALSFAATGLAVVGACGTLARGSAVATVPFAIIAAAGLFLGLSTVAGRGWALATALLLAAVQPGPAAISAWELAHGIPLARREHIQTLGLSPILGVTLNMIYSAAGSGLAAWALIRLRTTCRRMPPGSPDDGPGRAEHPPQQFVDGDRAAVRAGLVDRGGQPSAGPRHRRRRLQHRRVARHGQQVIPPDS